MSIDTKSLPGFSVRGRYEWVKWLKKAAARESRSVSSLIEVMAIVWARQAGLPDPPSRSQFSETAKFM